MAPLPDRSHSGAGVEACKFKMSCETLVEDPRAAVQVSRYHPSAARPTESVLDIGYDFPAEVADIADFSVMVGATQIDVQMEFAGQESNV